MCMGSIWAATTPRRNTLIRIPDRYANSFRIPDALRALAGFQRRKLVQMPDVALLEQTFVPGAVHQDNVFVPLLLHLITLLHAQGRRYVNPDPRCFALTFPQRARTPAPTTALFQQKNSAQEKAIGTVVGTREIKEP